MNKNKHPKLIKNKILLLIMMLIGSFVSAQTTVIKGAVIDGESRLPVSFASVYFKEGKGVTADSSGRFEISTERGFKELQVSYIGYKTASVSLQPGKEQTLTVELRLDASKDLNAIVIKSKNKIKYSNKNNPAVELIRRVIDNKDKNRPENYDYVEFEQYEKIQLALSRPTDKLAKSRLLKKYSFLFENTDTNTLKGKALTPVYLEEKLSSNFFRKDPKKNKTVIEGEKRVNFGEFIDSNGVSSYLKRLYEDVNVYENNVSLFTNQFLSPIADMAPSFYMFFIRDTITDETGKKLVKMYFTPRNTNDFLFRGTMYITLDGNYAVQKLDMTISPNINMNWVKSMQIHQTFEKNSIDERYHLIKSDISSELGISKGKGSSGVYGERSVSYKNYKINEPREESFYAASVSSNAAKADSFWVARRHDPLSQSESRVYQNIDSLRNMKSFKRFMDVATIFLAGYKSQYIL
jgi:hypothetical protein